uniref:Palmitoyl-protein thioesterase 1 n=1 Tax=Globodera rostochiensis TaxID=31243 RepID=A0A914HF74_GLORO
MPFKISVLLPFLWLLTLAANVKDPVPVVLWHGMGDSCCNPLSMGFIQKLIRTNVPRVYVRSLRIGASIPEDIGHGFLANMNDEVAKVCEQLAQDERLAAGYNAIGFSQGGLFVRALAQRCAHPPIRNLISIGGPQQGIFGLPYCPGSAALCAVVRRLLDRGAYTDFVQHNVVQAQYWHDPNPAERYRQANIFLADLNCEQLHCNSTYRDNMVKLRNFVLVQFSHDHKLVPKETASFGFFADNGTPTIIPMEQSAIYKEDRIGLKALNESNRLHLLSFDGEHLQIPTEVFVSEIIEPYLKDKSDDDRGGSVSSTSSESDEQF